MSRKTARHTTAQLSFGGALASEVTRFASLRSTWWFLGINIVLFPAGTTMLSLLMRFAATIGDEAGATSSASAAIPEWLVWSCITGMGGTCAVLLAIFGAMALAAEYSTNSIQMTFVANPRRMSVFWSKGLVAVVLCFVSSLIGVLLSWLVATIIFSGNKIDAVAQGDHLRLVLVGVLGVPLCMALFGLMGMGIAGIFRSMAMGILGALGVLYLLPTAMGVAQIASSQVSWITTVSSLLPTQAYSVFSSAGVSDSGGGEVSAAIAATAGGAGWTPSWWGGLLILAAWVALFGVVGSLVMKRSDIK
jgi:ABC-type transport system involved in multi-copper enzyme maturation permease subunit